MLICILYTLMRCRQCNRTRDCCVSIYDLSSLLRTSRCFIYGCVSPSRRHAYHGCLKTFNSQQASDQPSQEEAASSHGSRCTSAVKRGARWAAPHLSPHALHPFTLLPCWLFTPADISGDSGESVTFRWPSSEFMTMH